jgi:hypothetical protein
VKLTKVLQYLLIAFVIWWVIQQPTSASHLVHNIGTFLSTSATGVSHFLTSL